MGLPRESAIEFARSPYSRRSCQVYHQPQAECSERALHLFHSRKCNVVFAYSNDESGAITSAGSASGDAGSDSLSSNIYSVSEASIQISASVIASGTSRNPTVQTAIRSTVKPAG